MKKFLLCRPCGGLNDTLCQIEYCWQYAEKTNRHLIIDTLKSGVMANFSEFFLPLHENDAVRVSFETSGQLLETLNLCSCAPVEIQNRIDTYQIKYVPGELFLRDAETSARLGFDFDKDYEESLLVHHNAGGGNSSHKAIQRIRFNEKTAKKIGERLASIGTDYDTVHVRNTDYTCDYKAFFETIYTKVCNRKLLVCSDDDRVVQFARAYFNQSAVLSLSSSTSAIGKPLHHPTNYGTDEERCEATVRSLVDMVALAYSENLYVTTVTSPDGKTPGIRSGFSNLCVFLNKNKSILDGLLRVVI
jgi:hypothetical protein